MSWAEAFDWGTWVHSILGGAHFASALIALVLGPVIFFRGKGSSFHRVAGYVFVLAMLTVNITALTMYELSGVPNLFHFFAVLSLSALLPAFYYLQRAVRTRRNDYLELHASLMMWAYYGLAAAGVAQVLTRVLPPLVGSFGAVFAIIGGGLGVAGFICSFIFRMASKSLVRRYGFDQSSDAEGAINHA
ncbi:MAG: DUF2306 domain-containing protein [Pseudomonadota bacterium]